jgi:predicted dehydrogenase
VNRRNFMNAALAAGVAPSLSLGGTEPQAEPIKIGQIGTGHAHAAGKLATILKFPELFECVAYADAKGPRTDGPYAKVPHLTEERLLAMPGLRAVAVETDVPDLVPTAARCIAAGLHVHLDKPPGAIGPFRELLAAAEKRQRVVQLGYMLRYNPGLQFAFRAAREGWLGDVFEVHATMGKFVNDATRRQLDVPGGAMFELGCHLIDATVTLLGKPEHVHPFLQRTRPDDDRLQDNTLAVLEYPRATATIRVSLVEYAGTQRRQFVVCGDKGTVDVKPLEPPTLQLAIDTEHPPYRKGTQSVELPRTTGRYDGDFVDLAAIVRGEKKPDWDAAHDLAVHETLLRACGRWEG